MCVFLGHVDDDLEAEDEETARDKIRKLRRMKEKERRKKKRRLSKAKERAYYWDMIHREYFENTNDSTAIAGSSSSSSCCSSRSGCVPASEGDYGTIAIRPRIERDPFAVEYDLIMCIRYLERSLLSRVIPYLLCDGGVFMIHTFMVGAEKFGKPKNPDFLLKPNELVHLFCGRVDAYGYGDRVWMNGCTRFVFELVYDETSTLSDGRPVQNFVVRKRIITW